MDNFNFRVALLKKGLSQNQLAVQVGLHPQTLSAIVRGYKVPSHNLQQQIAEVLNVRASDIFSTQKEGCND